MGIADLIALEKELTERVMIERVHTRDIDDDVRATAEVTDKALSEKLARVREAINDFINNY